MKFPNQKSKNKTWRLLILSFVIGVVLLSGCGNNQPQGAISASGFIEGEEIMIAPETGGRIASTMVNEGDTVEIGQVLIQLDDALLLTQRGEALASLAAAEANLASVQAGARPAEIAAGQALLVQAQAQRDGALLELEHARQALENPQELNLQIVEAELQLALAEQGVESAQADLAEAEALYSIRIEETGGVDHLQYLQLEASRAALEAAEAQADGARRYLNALYRMRDNPLTLLAQLHGAEAQYAAAEAGVDAAQAALDALEAGPTEEELAMAEAQRNQAQAVVGLLDAQLAQLTLTSPIDGIVTSRSAHGGETATPGIPLLTLINLDQVTLVIYIPENRIGQIQVGQTVQVTVDTFPNRIFEGQVSALANEAEFTPQSVQTQEERVNLVFAVKVILPNPDHALKAGMPADAVITP